MNFFQKTKTWGAAHKAWSAIIVIAIVGAGYYAVRAATKGATVTAYALAAAQTGTIVTTVTGTGQVSADNQADVGAQVSGTIDAINVKVGQAVAAGQSLAHIDSSSAAQSLQSAQIAYSKLTEAPTTANLTQTYSNGYNSVTSAIADLLAIKAGLYIQLYETSGYGSNTGANANFLHTNQTAEDQWIAADQSYDKALNAYATASAAFQGSSVTDATSSIATLVEKTYVAAVAMQSAVNDANTLASFIANQDTSGKASSAASTAQTAFQGWSSTVNGDVSSLLSAQNSIMTLVQGPDALDVQSQELSLAQAQQDYDYTYVRAPFAGIVAKVDVTPAETISSGTTVATIVTPDEYATISLNEIDAAKIAAGQKATLTFDAISDLSIAGTVSEVDGIGTVSQGVVTYNVTIAFDTNDNRIKPGMSVNASIQTAVHAGVLVVPSAAVKTQGAVSYVQELNQTYPANQLTGVISATAPKNVPVTVGLSDNTNTEIVSGISLGDQIVTKTTTTGGAAAKTPAATATTRTGGGGFGGGGGGGASVLRAL